MVEVVTDEKEKDMEQHHICYGWNKWRGKIYARKWKWGSQKLLHQGHFWWCSKFVFSPCKVVPGACLSQIVTNSDNSNTQKGVFLRLRSFILLMHCSQQQWHTGTGMAMLLRIHADYVLIGSMRIDAKSWCELAACILYTEGLFLLWVRKCFFQSLSFSEWFVTTSTLHVAII